MAYTGQQKRDYQRRWIAARRAEYLKDKSCEVCGSTKELELDHIDPLNKIDHRIWSWSRSRIQKELEKCQFLCEECHINKTRTDGSHTVAEHGKCGMYENHGCRCDLCREWKRSVNAQRKARGWM